MAFVLMLMAIGLGMAVAALTQDPSHEGYFGHLWAVSETVTSDRHARIAEYLVTEGQMVEPGDPLVLLSDPRVEAARTEIQQRIGQLEAELSQTRAQVEVELQWRLEELEREIFETRLKSSKYLQERLSQQVELIARQEVMGYLRQTETDRQPIGEILQIRRQDSLAKDSSEIEALLKIHQSENAMEVAAVQVELCDKRIAKLQQLQQDFPEKLRQSMGIAVVAAKLAEARLELKQREQSRSLLTFRAELAGTVGVFKSQPGGYLQQGQAILDILDHEKRYLQVPVPSTDLDKFQRETLLELEFPGKTIRQGRVVEIPPQALPLTARERESSGGVTLVSIHVEPVGRVWPAVPFGTAVKVYPAK